jgi:Ca2+-binding RTX toxin-like protein
MSRKSLTLAVAIAVTAGAFVAVAAPASAARTCFGKRATLVGNNRDPRKSVELKGTPRNDVIVSLGGSDYIYGRGGDDLICAGGGDDYIEGGSGNDKIRGGDGWEDVQGGGGHDSIWGGGSPVDELHGNGGNDRLFGGPGAADTLFGGPGDDVMNGGEGRDIVVFVESPQGVHADLSTGEATGDGNDRMISAEELYGTFFNDVLYGDDGINFLGGGPGDDELHGRGGDDRLRSGEGYEPGTDLLDGGEGSDTAHYGLSKAPVEADLTTGQAVHLGGDTLESIENLFGSKESDVLIGDDGNNAIEGFLEDDVMDGRGGTDTAVFIKTFGLVVDLGKGTAVDFYGSDTLENFEDVIGSDSADTIIGDDGPNSIWGGRGADTLLGAGGDDALIGQRGMDSADGDIGSDTCDAETETNCELDTATTSAFSNWSPSSMTWRWGL